MPRVTTKRPDGDAIRDLRKRKGLSVPQLAAMLPGSRHPQSVRRLEVGKSVLASEVFLYQIANALGVSLADITLNGPEDGEDEEDEAA
jgi:transcriptional regulator with XRE-family HTH domain